MWWQWWRRCVHRGREHTASVYSAAAASGRAAEHEKEAQESSKRDTKEVLIPAAPLFRKGRPLKEPEQSSMQPASWLSSVHTYVHILFPQVYIQYIFLHLCGSRSLDYSMEAHTQNYVQRQSFFTLLESPSNFGSKTDPRRAVVINQAMRENTPRRPFFAHRR